MSKLPDQSGFHIEGQNSYCNHKAELESLSIPDGVQLTFHMIHLNHLDLMWYWQLPDTVEMCLETIRWHVEMIEAHPDARYSHTQVYTLKIVEELDPKLFERFRKLVNEGKIEIDSGQVVEPDHNLPSGESLVRQFLYGQRYLNDRFGVQAHVLINSDSFGHTRSLPQILDGFRIKSMIFKRPRQRFVNLPESPFIWRGIDGTEIPALRFINKGYGLPALSQYYTLPDGVSNFEEKVNRNIQAGIHHLLGPHCISDAGGAAPYVAPIEGKDYRLKYSLPTDFFRDMLTEKPSLPILDTLFNHLYQGCYTSHIEEKEHCRRAERELRALEYLWTLLSITRHEYPKEELNDAWWSVCFLQFHDIITGTGSQESHRDSGAMYAELFLRLYKLRRKAQIVLDKYNAFKDSFRSYTVANPRPKVAGGIVEIDVEMPICRLDNQSPCIEKSGVLESEDGESVPYQIISTRARQRFIRGTMIFPAHNVFPFGLKSYRITDRPSPKSTVSANGSILENEYIRVVLCEQGIIKSIVTKENGREYLRKTDAPVRIELWPETDYPGDYGSDMKAWMLGITDYHENAVKVDSLEVIENGPVRATIRVKHIWGSSEFTTDVSLYAGEKWVEIRTNIDWKEKEVLARLCVEPEISGTPELRYGIPFGWERATGDELEIAAAGWVDITGDNGGLAMLDLDRPGHCLREGALRLSLVRCATGDYDPCTDSGPISATIRLIPHGETFFNAGIPEKSDMFSHPMISWQNMDCGTADEAPMLPSINIRGDGIITTAFKQAEDAGRYILRLYESLGKDTKAVLSLNPSENVKCAWECNLMEDNKTQLFMEQEAFNLEFKPFEIKTIAFIVGNT